MTTTTEIRRVGKRVVQATVTFAGRVDREPVVVTATRHLTVAGGTRTVVNDITRVWDNRTLDGDDARAQAARQAAPRFADLGI